MKYKLLIIIVFFYILCLKNSFSQNKLRDSIDVLHYSIHLNVTEFVNQQISGFAELTIASKAKNLKLFNLDLLGFSVDSIFLNDSIQNQFGYNEEMIDISTFKPINFGDTFKVKVFYRGRPAKDSRWGGFFFSPTDAYNIGVGMGSNPPNFGRAWFPCNDNFVDKATYDYFITVKNKHKAICSGTFIHLINNENGTTTYFWKMKEQIPTYLASIDVSDFAEINWMYNGINRAIPVSIFVSNANKANAEKSFINLNSALSIFEKYFGPYRWDRVGFTQVSFNRGSMEHATNIAYPKYAIDGTLKNESLWVHELSHSWFGNLVTCKTEDDMWLNEGWASFSTGLFLEKHYGWEEYKKYFRLNHANVLQNTFVQDGAYRALTGVPHEYTYGSTVYDKGADVVHTLRFYLGDDLFFKTTQDYLNKFAFGNVSSVDFCNFYNKNAVPEVKQFFDFWVFSAGFPHYELNSISILENNKNFTLSYNIKQKLKGAKDFAKSNKIDIGLLNRNWKIETFPVMVSGENTLGQITIPYNPLAVFLDPEEKIADATTDCYKIIKQPGSYEYEGTLCTLDVENIVDSAFLRVVHNWISPEKTRRNDQDHVISNDRYWTIEGVFPKKFKAHAKFYYELAFGLDNSLLAQESTSLTILYREDKDSDWSILKSEVVPINTKRGNIFIKNIQPGDYTIGIK